MAVETGKGAAMAERWLLRTPAQAHLRIGRVSHVEAHRSTRDRLLTSRPVGSIGNPLNVRNAYGNPALKAKSEIVTPKDGARDPRQEQPFPTRGNSRLVKFEYQSSRCPEGVGKWIADCFPEVRRVAPDASGAPTRLHYLLRKVH